MKRDVFTYLVIAVFTVSVAFTSCHKNDDKDDSDDGKLEMAMTPSIVLISCPLLSNTSNPDHSLFAVFPHSQLVEHFA